MGEFTIRIKLRLFLNGLNPIVIIFMNIIRERIERLKDSNVIAYCLAYKGICFFMRLLRFLRDPAYRSIVFTGLRFGQNYHQRDIATAPNRYPLLFQACAEYLTTIHNPKILSFGCSTGEEVQSISQYILGAKVVGVDINKWCIRQCNRNNTNPDAKFIHRVSQEFSLETGFDAIFCMALFQRTENRSNKSNRVAQGFVFEQFEREVTLLDGKLNPGGLMIIDHSDFSFTDVGCAAKYIPLDFKQNQLVRNRPLFDPNNQKIAEVQNNYRVFVKSEG